MGVVHPRCPNLHPNRYGRLDTRKELSDDRIRYIARCSYKGCGFTGLIGWIYYNEPLLQADRMFRLMDGIMDDCPQARFILWTNGTLIPVECNRFRLFSQIVVSGYGPASRRGYERLLQRDVVAIFAEDSQLDNRLMQIAPEDSQSPCLRPFVEMIVDNYGNTHLCCYDWQGLASWGNVWREDWYVLAERWRDMLPDIAGKSMSPHAPEYCRGCGFRHSDKYQLHDRDIIRKAQKYRRSLN